MGIEILLGKTLNKVEKIEDREIIFTTSKQKKYRLYHNQDCCESVTIKDICGDLDDLIKSPIIQAEESTNQENKGCESSTWTFYRLATAKGQVVISFLGESNGYYSESVDFEEVTSF